MRASSGTRRRRRRTTVLAPHVTKDEPQRLHELHALGILDTPPEERFDRLTRIAKALFDVPMVMVAFVGDESLWFKSKIGLDACELPRATSFCGHAIHAASVFMIPDASRDERFADSPLVVGPPHVRFYAGAPLFSPTGRSLGTFCIIDTKVRSLSGAQMTLLRDLADAAQHEMTQSVGAVAHLEAETSALVAVLNTVADSIVTMDESGIIQSANAATQLLFGHEPAELIGQPFEVLISREHREAQGPFAPKDLVTGGLGGETTTRRAYGQRRDHSTFPVELSVGEMHVGGYVGAIRDITARKALEDELHRVAREDPLTGLQNRNVLREYTERALPQARRSGRRIACLCIDLDAFKPVNDRYGHEAGDKVLKIIARRLREHVRDGDLVVRTGGDEFVVLMGYCPDLPFAQAVAGRITAAIAEPMQTQWGTINVTASAGVSIFPDDATDESGLIEAADRRMYRDKRRRG